MKKLSYLSPVLVFILALSVSVQASENLMTLIISGYTESGIYYEVLGQTSIQPSSDNISVTRQVIYEGKIVPERQIFWQETINGVACTGTLKLSEVIYKDNKTMAIYRGTLTVKK